MRSYRADSDRILSAELLLAPPASYALLKQAEARKLDPELVPRDVRKAKFLPGSDAPMYVARGDDWRAYLGGVLVHLWVPRLDGSGMTGARIAAIFADSRASKVAWDMERTMLRGTAYFRLSEGRWYLQARYRARPKPSATREAS
jgi:hypothetical protein